MSKQELGTRWCFAQLLKSSKHICSCIIRLCQTEKMHLLAVVAINKLPRDLYSQFSFGFTICGYGNDDAAHGLCFITHTYMSTLLLLRKFKLFIGLVEKICDLLNFSQVF